jgi:tetratricopeptide (TPR) repeat protein
LKTGDSTAGLKTGHSIRLRAVLLGIGLLVATLLAYQPAWHGTEVWDDDGHLTQRELRTTEGLRRIWIEPGATQQYYPLVHSAFWLQHRLWGNSTTGYHIVNIVLHALSAFLVFLILTRLNVPGAALAAVIFALHPVHVESVAWMTQLKNTLSGFLYLSAALLYLRFVHDRPNLKVRPSIWYFVALALFILALASKTVTFSLPIVLLIVFWWRQGRLDWRRDLLPLTPFIAAGLAAAAITIWMEREFIGARGEEFAFTFVERILIAGHAIWFYAGKLVWPANLMFTYPRWDIDATAWWQYLYPLGVVVILAALWVIRTRTRAPFAAVLMFCITLGPALGFVNVYPFRFSFVADHFQYLASIPMIALAAGGFAWFVRHRRADVWPKVEAIAAVTVALVFGVLVARQSAHFVDADTLYRRTLEANPSSWMAHHNLGASQLNKPGGRLDEAVGHLEAALRLNPRYADAHNSIGVALKQMGRLDEASSHHEEAIRLKPDFAAAHNNLGAVRYLQERFDQAEAHYRKALEVSPGYADARRNLGLVLARTGRPAEALDHFRAALDLSPDSAEAHANLGSLLFRLKRYPEAIPHLQDAVRLDPNHAAAHYELGNAFQEAGRLPEAIGAYQRALAFEENARAAVVHNDYGVALALHGRLDDAIAQFSEALKLQPDDVDARNNLQRAQATLKSRGR